MRSPRAKTRAYSLLDLLVSIVLSGIIAYIMFLFATGVGRHYFNLTEKMSQIERASFFERALAKELAKTSPAGINLSPATPAGQTMAVQSYEAAVPPGRLRWSPRVFVLRYVAPDKMLLARPSSLDEMGVESSYGHPEPLAQETLLRLPMPDNASQLLKWQDVTSFSAEKVTGTPSVRVSATFEKQGVRQNRHSYKSDRLYPIWNDYEP